jgi:hypothetical protein
VKAKRQKGKRSKRGEEPEAFSAIVQTSTTQFTAICITAFPESKRMAASRFANCQLLTGNLG